LISGKTLKRTENSENIEKTERKTQKEVEAEPKDLLFEKKERRRKEYHRKTTKRKKSWGIFLIHKHNNKKKTKIRSAKASQLGSQDAARKNRDVLR